MKTVLLETIEHQLKQIYGDQYDKRYMEMASGLIRKWSDADWPQNDAISEKNVYLITYGDSIHEEGMPTLETLHRFLNEYIKGVITDVHLLPMFPYTSDDGFSVTDYREIHPELGNWSNIETLSKDYRMMFDFVANHISKSSEWFQRYLQDDPEYKHYFIPHDPEFDTKNVVRPRTSPLFHEYKGKNGVKTAWTTFSEDQVDVNVAYFPLLLEMTDILLTYAYQGGTSIRLDAIGFLWKESGTSCMHLPQTHTIIQMWRTLLDHFKPGTQIITETNVPHKENISYFGDGTNEAQMVYQFSLPPLVLYTMTTHDSGKLTDWAKTIGKVSDTATYFNFLASHDGIGMRPTEGILTEGEKQLLVNKVVENGGRVSYKNNSDGTQSVYELNINYSEALVNKGEDITDELKVQKMLAAHSILLSFIGVPAIYYHSLLGSQNDQRGVEESGINRRINREKFDFDTISRELTESPRRKAIFGGLKKMIEIRQAHSAFSPFAEQEVVDMGTDVFALKRFNKETGEEILFAVNVKSSPVKLSGNLNGTNLLTGEKTDSEITLKPYEFVWILN
ncbi:MULTISPECIES: alpha-amylase family glycosyl hydrolase [Cytobacillus]|uniref:alpha-amylase family glycosyl hydrolase n=1 Tax=Cytobacillus TaxID=2675230 RepID=UPI00203CB686|nr:alpha-amylase family glycosyl hydrolase [Cytobacillus firmus]MCM3706452.1 alpha-amylase family glycosyl hydrolase [Cytobacillus firmus]